MFRGRCVSIIFYPKESSGKILFRIKVAMALLAASTLDIGVLSSKLARPMEMPGMAELPDFTAANFSFLFWWGDYGAS